MLHLGLNFFARSLEYKNFLMDEIYYLVKYANFNYSEVLNMPIYERKYYLNKLLQEYKKE